MHFAQLCICRGILSCCFVLPTSFHILQILHIFSTVHYPFTNFLFYFQVRFMYKIVFLPSLTCACHSRQVTVLTSAVSDLTTSTKTVNTQHIIHTLPHSHSVMLIRRFLCTTGSQCNQFLLLRFMLYYYNFLTLLSVNFLYCFLNIFSIVVIQIYFFYFRILTFYFLSTCIYLYFSLLFHCLYHSVLTLLLYYYFLLYLHLLCYITLSLSIVLILPIYKYTILTFISLPVVPVTRILILSSLVRLFYSIFIYYYLPLLLSAGLSSVFQCAPSCCFYL